MEVIEDIGKRLRAHLHRSKECLRWKSEKAAGPEARGSFGPVTFWLGLFFLVPLLLILIFSFGTSGVYGGITLGFNPGNYLKVFDPLYLEIVGRTFVIALTNTLLCLALGYPLAYFIVFKGGRRATP